MTDRDRTIDLTVEVPGSPEEVWRTIATGPGISSWFIPMTVEEREGGAVVFDWGSYGTQTGRVTAWEPPHRVAYEDDDEQGLAYEWLVEAREGGTCVVRLVNSGFGHGDGWDEQFDGMTKGWPLYFENLRLQRTHFRGVGAQASIPTVLLPGPGAAAWTSFCDAIGVSPSLRSGDRFETSGDGVPRLTGTVATDWDEPAARACFVVLDGPAPGTAFVSAEGEGALVACSVYTYRYADEPLADEWTPYLLARWPHPDAMPSAASG